MYTPLSPHPSPPPSQGHSLHSKSVSGVRCAALLCLLSLCRGGHLPPIPVLNVRLSRLLKQPKLIPRAHLADTMQLCGNPIMNKQSKCQFAKNEFHNSWRDTAPCSLLYLVHCVVAMVTLVLLEHQRAHPLLHHCSSSIVANRVGPTCSVGVSA